MLRTMMRLIPLAIVYATNPSIETHGYTMNTLNSLLSTTSVSGDDEINEALRGVREDEAEKALMLNLSKKGLTKIPSNLKKFKNLECLYLSNNEIEILEGGVLKAFPSLKRLVLSHNHLKKVDIGAFEGLPILEEIDFSVNRLETIESEVFDGLSIKSLNLSINRLEKVGNRVFKRLSSLESLDLSVNRVKVIEGGAFEELLNLKTLTLSRNRLEKIDINTFKGLSSLKELDLANNWLKTIKNGAFEGLSNLKLLQLQNNDLKTLPSCIRNLKDHLTLINLQNNPNFLYSTAEDNALARVDLVQIFGDKILFDEVKFNNEIVDEKSFLEKHKTRNLYWNLDELKKLRLKEVDKTKLTKYDMIGIVSKASGVELIGVEEKKLLVDYINVLYDPKTNYTRWRPKLDDIPLLINLLGYFLDYLNQAIEKGNDLKSLKYSLSEIVESIKHCPDGQISALKDVYATILCDYEYEKNELSNFIENKIVAEKEYKFKFLMTPNSSQNVHVLNYWTYEFRDTLGFGMVFESTMGTMGQDPFGGHRGNALKAFLDCFTPEYMIDVLTVEINKNKKMMCDLMKKIHEDNKLTEEEKEQLGVDVLDYEKCNKINSRVVEYMLLDMNLIVKKTPEKCSTNVAVNNTFVFTLISAIRKFREIIRMIFHI